jgi:hypothetical protein
LAPFGLEERFQEKVKHRQFYPAHQNLQKEPHHIGFAVRDPFVVTLLVMTLNFLL